MLLEKLKFYGVKGKFYNIVKSYLDGRLYGPTEWYDMYVCMYQKVILSHNNCIESTWEKVKQGVPQGLTLGPIFFSLFI